MPTGKAVQGRLPSNVHRLAFGAHINVIEPPRTTIGTQADAVDQDPLFQPVLLHHQAEPDKRVDLLAICQGVQQWIAIVLRHLRIAQGNHLGTVAQP
ncbi:hypothetical protein D3C75_1055710 [compost metagenome]